MHPSKRFKRATAFVVLCGVISIVALMVNEATVNDAAVWVFGQMGLLFVANMLAALVARYAINQAVWPSVPKWVGAAMVLVFASAALLLADYMPLPENAFSEVASKSPATSGMTLLRLSRLTRSSRHGIYSASNAMMRLPLFGSFSKSRCACLTPSNVNSYFFRTCTFSVPSAYPAVRNDRCPRGGSSGAPHAFRRVKVPSGRNESADAVICSGVSSIPWRIQRSRSL